MNELVRIIEEAKTEALRFIQELQGLDTEHKRLVLAGFMAGYGIRTIKESGLKVTKRPAAMDCISNRQHH